MEGIPGLAKMDNDDLALFHCTLTPVHGWLRSNRCVIARGSQHHPTHMDLAGSFTRFGKIRVPPEKLEMFHRLCQKAIWRQATPLFFDERVRQDMVFPLFFDYDIKVKLILKPLKLEY
jgi:hypothetical protein